MRARKFYILAADSNYSVSAKHERWAVERDVHALPVAFYVPSMDTSRDHSLYIPDTTKGSINGFNFWQTPDLPEFRLTVSGPDGRAVLCRVTLVLAGRTVQIKMLTSSHS